MKGIIWADGDTAGLPRLTQGMPKHLLPVYDKPMVYYPLSVLMLAGVSDVVLAAPPFELAGLRGLLGDGSELGLRLRYVELEPGQERAEAVAVAAEHLGAGPVAVIDGDAVLWGAGLSELLKHHARTFAGEVRFTVGGLDTGLEFADSPSPERSKVVDLDSRFTYVRADTYDGLLAASRRAQLALQRHGVRVGCVEETAWRMGFIDAEQCGRLGERLAPSGYGQYLRDIAATDEVALPQAS